MTADTRVFDRPPDLTPEQVHAATGKVIGDVGDGEPEFPSPWEPGLPRVPRLDAEGDYAAWVAAQRRARNLDWARATNPERYARTFR